MSATVDIVPLQKVIDPYDHYKFNPLPAGGTLVEGGWLPIIVHNAAPQQLSQLLREVRDGARVLVKRTVVPFERVELEILDVTPLEGALPLPTSFEGLKQLYLELRSKLLQPIVPSELYAELEAASAELRAAASASEAAKRDWVRTWRCAICGAPIVRAAQIGISGVAPDGPRGLYISQEDRLPEDYSCARLEEAKRITRSTYLFSKMTAKDWEEVRNTIDAHKDFKIVEDEVAKQRYESARKRVEELERRVKELKQRIKEHQEFYSFLRKELERDIQQVAKALVDFAKKHNIELFDHFGEETSKVLCDADGLVL
jgi:hypothetical protein